MLVVGMLLSGCETAGYYGQAALGQARLLLAREPVAEILTDGSRPAALRERLASTREMLDFAESELALEPGRRYRSYVELDRAHVAWNVFAAPRYALDPVLWCFPVAGCVSYRGYFDESAARAKADELAGLGFDVHVGPVDAYSTLGWFDDPLLSSFLQRDRGALAELLFHELAHGIAYVPGETAFNESYATLVGREGARRWLEARGETDALRVWTQRAELRSRFVRAVLDGRARVATIYGGLGNADDAARESARERAWEELRERWLATREEALEPWDVFFTAPPSNARLNTVADYNVHLPAFRALLGAVGGDFERFHDRVRELAADDAARARFLAGADQISR